jgi:hypothetical protein
MYMGRSERREPAQHRGIRQAIVTTSCRSRSAASSLIQLLMAHEPHRGIVCGLLLVRAGSVGTLAVCRVYDEGCDLSARAVGPVDLPALRPLHQRDAASCVVNREGNAGEVSHECGARAIVLIPLGIRRDLGFGQSRRAPRLPILRATSGRRHTRGEVSPLK